MVGNIKLIVFGVLALAALFAGRVWLLNYTEARESLAEYGERTAVVEGRVVGDPDKRATSMRVVLRVETINGQDAPHGKILVLLPRETTVSYGERLEVRGLVVAPEAFETDTGRVFDYPGYLRVRGVSMVMERAVLREQEPAGPSLEGALFALKHRFEGALEQVLPEPQVSLLKGMLLGERGGFDQALMSVFVVAGLVHIVVLSGTNIAIVSEALFRFLGAFRMRRTYIYALGFVGIVLFALMVGGGAATVRAVIMGSIAILARYFRRPEAALRALALAAALMVLWNPLVLLYDTGFMLSVLATFGLITLAPYIEGWLTMLPAHKRFNVRSIVATTIAVEIFILPALLYTSGVMSFVSLPVNALVLPLVPLAMLAGFVVGIVGLIHPVFAFIPALAAQLLLSLILGIAEVSAALPFASTLVVPFPWYVAAAAYVPLTWLALQIYSRQRSSSNS